MVKAGALYGVEIWRWRRREEIEKLQEKFVKMALRVAKNTSDYIWQIISGKAERGGGDKKKGSIDSRIHSRNIKNERGQIVQSISEKKNPGDNT